MKIPSILSVLYEFKNEIEMEKLKIEACIKQYRKIDMEIEELIFSKCSGQEADYLFEQWRMIVQKNEQISNKRWLSNEKWLQAYEEEFLKRYANSNPFFKKGKEKPTYAEAINHNKNNIIIIKTDLLMIMSKMYNIIKEDINQMTTEIHKISEDIINI